MKDDESLLNADASQQFLDGKISSEKESDRFQKNKVDHGKYSYAAEQIAELGTNRWELVSVIREATEDPKLVLFFKRPLK